MEKIRTYHPREKALEAERRDEEARLKSRIFGAANLLENIFGDPLEVSRIIGCLASDLTLGKPELIELYRTEVQRHPRYEPTMREARRRAA